MFRKGDRMVGTAALRKTFQILGLNKRSHSGTKSFNGTGAALMNMLPASVYQRDYRCFGVRSLPSTGTGTRDLGISIGSRVMWSFVHGSFEN